MLHAMNLQRSPFLSIKSGRKRIEMRLYDDKRKMVKVGDMVEFTDVTTQEKLVCEVINLHIYPTFDELYQNHDKISIGYMENETADPKDMFAYYPQEEINKYGVVGIEVKTA